MAVMMSEISIFMVCGVGNGELCFVGSRKGAYQGLRPSRSRSSSVAALRMSNGTAE
jgi:hypothetical protein